MKVYPERLSGELNRNLAAVYLIHGEERLLREEAAQAIREQAATQGYTERNVFFVEKGFNWSHIDNATDTLSLFAEKKFIDIRFENMPSPTEKKSLAMLPEKLNADTLVVISTKKLDNSQQKAQWFKALDSAGINVPCWPVTIDKLPQWLAQRARSYQLAFDKEALWLLANFVEGNLYAAKQELEKLSLIHQGGTITADILKDYVTASARYNNFLLIDSILQGETQRVLNIITGLKSEGGALIALVALLARELRKLISMAFRQENGEPLNNILKPPLVWNTRKGLYLSALKRLNVVSLQLALRRCYDLDKAIKSGSKGDPWDELVVLALMMCGVQQWQKSTAS